MATATKMHPADALLEGRKHVRRNSRGAGFFTTSRLDYDPKAPVGAACATGAMAIGYGLMKASASLGEAARGGTPTTLLFSRDPRLSEHVSCPVRDCGEEGDVLDIVLDLNDGHEWEQRRIAAWLRRVVPA
jgi:hypothetical protein